MKLILSSSDFGNPESAQFIRDNVSPPITDCKVLYFPNEKATEEKIKSNKYVKRLSELGFRKENIFVFNYYDPEPYFSLKPDLIYISGGNTFGTLKRIRESGADQLITDLVHNGATYVGGSAGAHIATANISHVAKYDGDTYGLSNHQGLGLYGGILICHCGDDRRADYNQLNAEGKYRVTALKDNESIIIRED
ncbi:MAG: Type 1 glutamine amidotransferase-like domain-containing protein [Clostridia bacterium]|nr:Type 1 glutamine amidotransferase-like domain-containing protein [Clostridia bacterium]